MVRACSKTSCGFHYWWNSVGIGDTGLFRSLKRIMWSLSLLQKYFCLAEKESLAFEVPGSVESQIQALIQAVVSNEIMLDGEVQ